MKFPLLSTFCFSLLTFSLSFSQTNQNISLFREETLLFDSFLNNASNKEHTSIKPYLNSPELEAISDSIKESMKRRIDFFPSIVTEDKKKGDRMINVNGIFTSQLGYEQAAVAKNKLLLDGGLSLDAWYNHKFSLNLIFFSGNSSFPSYIDTSIKHSHVIPGIGSAYSSKQNYSYQYYSGYFSYSPNRIFNVQIGKDKHFWGDGYRSLFLSDVSNSFPFLKISTTAWKIKYVNLFTMMKDVTDSPFKNDFKNKYGTFHYLSWNATKRINLSLFESIIWQGEDSNRVRNFDVNYLNPVIFYRPVEYSLGSSDNALLGFAYKIKAGEKNHQQFYGQIILDEFLLKEVLAVFKKIAHPLDHTIKYGWWGNKQGVQLGFKSFDLFSLKNLYFQTEINAVRPYTYSHGSVQQNYGNYNQALAHPLGANFTESVSILNYHHRKWMVEAEFLYAIYGKDKDTLNYGGNIFLSYTDNRAHDYGNKFWQGLKTNMFYTQLRLAYYLIPSSDVIAEAGVAIRQEKNSAASLSSSYFFIGIKTGLMNRYNDF